MPRLDATGFARHALAVALFAAWMCAGDAARAQPSPLVRVEAVAGPLSARALRAALPARRFAHCQGTFMGGVVWLRVRADPAGALSVESARIGGEEIGSYVPCVRRVVRRARVAPRPVATVARVAVEFMVLGLGPPRRPHIGNEARPDAAP